jgi:hypothetical protein
MSFKTSKNPLLYPVLINKILGALSVLPTAALLVPCKLGIFNANVPVTPSTPLSALTPPTWPGAAAVTVSALTGPVSLDANNLGVTAEAIFTCATPPVGGDLIYGYFITDSAGTGLLIAERFDAPVAIALPEDFVSVQFVLPEPFSRPWSGN